MQTTSLPRERIHYGWTTWFILVHGAGLTGIVYAITDGVSATLWFAVAYFFLCHLSITCGAHRLYAHVSYHATSALQHLYLVLFSGTMQGPMAWWSGKHRLHHKAVDTARDPHSPSFGFWRSHIGWMCTREGIAPPQTSFMRFGKRERAGVMWQFANYWPLAIIMGVALPTFVCGILWGDWVGGVLVAVFARLLLQYHLTWVVNSVCHRYGRRVDGAGTARDMPLLGILTVGESYHGSHHADDLDWRLGRAWYALDPGKWFIWLCFKLRLAYPRGA